MNFSGIFSFEETAPQKIKLMEKFNYITNLEKFVKQNPKDADALKLVFKICCNGAKYADTDAKKNVYHKKALEYFKQLIQLDPSSRKKAEEELKK